MHPRDLIDRLERQGALLVDALRGVRDEALRWKPAAERWSILEVIGHLLDEETGDFRVRIEQTLDRAGEWQPIDPEAWVVERRHQDADPSALLDALEDERAASLAWLRSLGAVDWSSAYDHPQLGVVSAGDLLAAWVAHDLMHLRQVMGLEVEWLREAAAPYSIRYAAP